MTKRLGKRERRAMRTEAERRADLKNMGLPRSDEPEVDLPDVSEPEPEGIETKDAGCDVVEACSAFDGALTFEEVDAWREGRDKANQAYELTSIFRDIVDNILASEAIEDKGAAIAKAASEFQKRIKQDPTEKSLIERIKGALFPAKTAPATIVAKKKEASFIVRKEADGSYRWFGWVTNKWRDIDPVADPKHGGEILTEAAHKEFISYLDAHPDAAPELWAWHTPGTKHGAADWWDYADGFVVMSGPLTETVGKSFENETEPLGMSHGFFAIPPWRDTANGLINKYRTFEASHLPLARAANPWTDFETIRKEAAMFNPEKRKYLVERLGEEAVAGLEADTKGRAALLEAIGVESKQAEEAPPAPPIPAPLIPAPPVAEPKVVADSKPSEPGIVTEDPAEVAPVAAKAEDQAQTIEAVLKTLDVPGLNVYLKTLTDKVEAQATTIKKLEAGVKAATQSLDDKVAAIITPQVSAVIPLWSQRPSQADDTVLTESDEDKALKAASPHASWVGDAIKPVQ